MTQKVKTSPSLKGILKEELREDSRVLLKGVSADVDLAHKRISDLDKDLTDRFHSVYARLSDLEIAALDRSGSLSWENIYWIVLCAGAVLMVTYFMVSKIPAE